MACLNKMPRRPRLLIVGCGDVGLRVLKHLPSFWRVFALTSSPQRAPSLRAAGAQPVVGNLDDATSLHRLGHLADAVLHLAPPPSQGLRDPRTANLLRALARAGRVRRLVYGSTTGVYGNARGAWLDETASLNASTERAHRRVDAERQVRQFGRCSGTSVTVLRIPGIYARDRDGGHPRERLLRGTPVLNDDDDVFTNHIHADDLARACIAALHRGLPQRVLNVCDDSDLKMGQYFDLAADIEGLPRPRRIAREQARAELSPMLYSFMSESRRLDNRRMHRELGLALRYPTVHAGLALR
jgi:nucleoside-diphosphate-sugar epimerase